MKSFKILAPFVLLFSIFGAHSEENVHVVFESSMSESRSNLISHKTKKSLNNKIFSLKPGSTLEVPSELGKQRFTLQNIRSTKNRASLSAFSEDGKGFITLAENKVELLAQYNLKVGSTK
ncbi:hypothetical protein QT397_15370 [Microbulbifer sp. MKSA007]|nr:hypothetical protein QT397_15370 [Microbulbifer sp. MKSA007]